MNAPQYTSADLEMAAFLASRSLSSVLAERPITSINTILNNRYDQETEQHLRYLRNLNERKAS